MITLTQAHIMGYGCKDCTSWKHQVLDVGRCKRQRGIALTLASEICEYLRGKPKRKEDKTDLTKINIFKLTREDAYSRGCRVCRAWLTLQYKTVLRAMSPDEICSYCGKQVK